MYIDLKIAHNAIKSPVFLQIKKMIKLKLKYHGIENYYLHLSFFYIKKQQHNIDGIK